ncbi:MAG TPA: cytochrome C oxidase subunit IV family protein [Chitinophagales bacterium]|nr:cytochrome C oxidase subunit IV family protein [Chitinophagales bacterium]
MTRQNIFIWALLMTLTVSAGLLSRVATAYIIPIIIFLAAVKFIAVAFYFMEMKMANSFWKIFLSIFIIAFSVAILKFIY